MTKIDDHSILLDEQILYYRARASEYDEWFFRKGRYDRGAELNKKWFAEIEQVCQALDAFRPTGNLLEIACGTGLWTEQLIRYARWITAIDAASEMLTLNQSRVQSKKVNYLQADIFHWNPIEKYNVVFFGFWLSHVPPEQFRLFWDLVRSALKPRGRVFFIDSRYNKTSTAKDHHLEGSDATIAKRKLNDGREFSILKIFYEKTKLLKQLNELGWRLDIYETPNYFIYGSGYKE